MPRPTRIVGAIALIAIALSPFAAFAGQVRVTATSGNSFSPATVQLNEGDQVVWVWTGNQHNIISGDPDTSTPDGLFNSGSLQNMNGSVGTAFTWVSSVLGSREFFCAQHAPDMRGVLQISPSGVAVSDFRITEVQYSATGGLDRIEITNLGAAAGDLGRFRISVGAGTQTVVPLNSVPVPAGGRVNVHTNEAGTNTATNLFMSGLGDLPSTGSVALFTPQAQGGTLGALSAPLMVDFVQWGASGRPNEATANSAGYWTTGDFVGGVDDPGFSIAFCGNATDRGVASWSVAHPNFGTQPPCSTPTATTSWGRIKILYR